jgi:hypothetical protein
MERDLPAIDSNSSCVVSTACAKKSGQCSAASIIIINEVSAADFKRYDQPLTTKCRSARKLKNADPHVSLRKALKGVLSHNALS